MTAGRAEGAAPWSPPARAGRLLPALALAILAGFTWLNLPAGIGDDSLHHFAGLFHVLRRAAGVGHEPFSGYLQQTCAAVTACPDHDHAYPVRYAVGYVYPLLSTLDAGFAELARRALPPGVPYMEIVVRAGAAAILVHWLVFIGMIGGALNSFSDPGQRARLAAALIVAVGFDYLVSINQAVFQSQPVFGRINFGHVYGLTVFAPRFATAAVIGLYLAGRLLDAPGSRRWLLPVSLIFHLGVATTLCLALFVVDALSSWARRVRSPDLSILALSAGAGLLISAVAGSSGYPQGFEDGTTVTRLLGLLAQHVFTHPLARYPALAAIGTACLAAGVWLTRRRSAPGAAMACMVVSAMAFMQLVQTATWQLNATGLVNWQRSLSVHGLAFLFVYPSSALVLGLSLWALVRAGEWLTARGSRHLGPAAATALAAAVAYSAALGIGIVTTPGRPGYTLVNPRPSSGTWREILRPELSPYYAVGPAGGSGLDDPRLHFGDRTFWIARSWWFTTVVHLRALHQAVVLGALPADQLVTASWPPAK